MWTITFWLEKAATFQYDHTNHQQKENNANPVNFFHGLKIFYNFTNANIP